MIVHKYKNMRAHKRDITSHCGETLPMAMKDSGIWEPKPIPPPNCLNDESKVTCHKCIDIMIEIYKKRIAVLWENRQPKEGDIK